MIYRVFKDYWKNVESSEVYKYFIVWLVSYIKIFHMSGVFLIISNNSTNNYSSMSPWFFFRSLNSKYHPWTGLNTISPFPDTRHGTAMTSSLCKLSIKSVMSSLIPSMVQGLTLLISWELICHSQKSFGSPESGEARGCLSYWRWLGLQSWSEANLWPAEWCGTWHYLAVTNTTFWSSQTGPSATGKFQACQGWCAG